VRHGLLKFWAFSPHRKGAQYPTLLKRKDSITIHMSEEGFDWKGVNYFIQKDE